MLGIVAPFYKEVRITSLPSADVKAIMKVNVVVPVVITNKPQEEVVKGSRHGTSDLSIRDEMRGVVS